MSYPTPFPPEFDPISIYTRAQAIEDGVLVDATAEPFAAVTREHFKVHVAMTAAVFALIERAVDDPRCDNDYPGVWHDICWMLRTTISLESASSSRSALLFKVAIAEAGRSRLWTLKALMGPGDRAEPCLTIMLPDED
jgi:uncharacterized protein DUF6573